MIWVFRIFLILGMYTNLTFKSLDFIEKTIHIMRLSCKSKVLKNTESLKMKKQAGGQIHFLF